MHGLKQKASALPLSADSDHSGDSNGRWPDFIVIGAMKSGTSTLYRYLDRHSRVFMSRHK